MFNILLNHCKFLNGPQFCSKRRCLDCIRWSASNKLSTKSKTHYDTLNLSRNCTSKEIREAFLTLSKQYHPDKNRGNPKAQEEFVKVSEAYNVLIKPTSRRDYDFSLISSSGPRQAHQSGKQDQYYEVHRYDPHFRDPWKDPSFYRNRNFDEEDKNGSYYGIRGIKKQPNDSILFWIVVFAGVGLFVQLSIIRFANSNTQRTRDRQSEENSRHLEYVRARAEFYATRERQVEEFKRRTMIIEGDKPESSTSTEDKPE